MAQPEDQVQELISIKEAARRLGVSDVAVGKWIKSGITKVASRTERGNRALLAWPQVMLDWQNNADHKKRSHAGGKAAPPIADLVKVPVKGLKRPAPPAPVDLSPEAVADDIEGGTFQDARAVKEKYQAKLAKLEYEERSGLLVHTSKVKEDAFKVARTIRDGVMNIPDRLANELAYETDPNKVHFRLTQEIRSVLEALASMEAPE